jgi:hypothetical protein
MPVPHVAREWADKKAALDAKREHIGTVGEKDDPHPHNRARR